MPIEIRELIIKVKIEASSQSISEDSTIRENVDIQSLKKTLLKECKKEIKKEIDNLKHR